MLTKKYVLSKTTTDASTLTTCIDKVYDSLYVNHPAATMDKEAADTEEEEEDVEEVDRMKGPPTIRFTDPYAGKPYVLPAPVTKPPRPGFSCQYKGTIPGKFNDELFPSDELDRALDFLASPHNISATGVCNDENGFWHLCTGHLVVNDHKPRKAFFYLKNHRPSEKRDPDEEHHLECFCLNDESLSCDFKQCVNCGKMKQIGMSEGTAFTCRVCIDNPGLFGMDLLPEQKDIDMKDRELSIETLNCIYCQETHTIERYCHMSCTIEQLNSTQRRKGGGKWVMDMIRCRDDCPDDCKEHMDPKLFKCPVCVEMETGAQNLMSLKAPKKTTSGASGSGQKSAMLTKESFTIREGKQLFHSPNGEDSYVFDRDCQQQFTFKKGMYLKGYAFAKEKDYRFDTRQAAERAILASKRKRIGGITVEKIPLTDGFCSE